MFDGIPAGPLDQPVNRLGRLPATSALLSSNVHVAAL